MSYEQNFTRVPYEDDSEGGTTKVKIISEQEISGGDFGDIFLVEIEEIAGKEAKRFMIEKRFKPGFNKLKQKIDSPEERARAAFNNYKLAKEVGLRVFPTYRLSEAGTSILMTNGNSDSFICIGSNDRSPSIESMGFDKIEEIENLTEIGELLFTQAEKATEKKIFVHSDSYMFFLDKKTQKKIDFVIGDLDNTSRNDSFEEPALFEDNLTAGFNSLYFFVARNCTPKNRNTYQAFVDNLETQYLNRNKFLKEGVKVIYK